MPEPYYKKAPRAPSPPEASPGPSLVITRLPGLPRSVGEFRGVRGGLRGRFLGSEAKLCYTETIDPGPIVMDKWPSDWVAFFYILA